MQYPKLHKRSVQDPRVVHRALFSSILAALAAFALVVPSAVAAQAEEASSVIEVLQLNTPEVLEDVASSTPGLEDSDLVVEADVTLSVPTSPDEVITITDGDSSIGIGLPVQEAETEATVEADGVVAFENLDGSTVVPVAKTDGSVQIITIIDHAEAPTRYEYPLTLPAGSTIEVDAAGFVSILGSAGEWLGGVLPPWATDSEGKSVPTHFELDGTTLTQVVEHSNAFTYPVIADPYAGRKLISRVDLGFERGNYRFFVYPTAFGTQLTAYGDPNLNVGLLAGRVIMQTNGWQEVLALRPEAANRVSVKQQFDCHTVYAATKTSYNLEAWRPSRTNWLTSPVQCNWE